MLEKYNRYLIKRIELIKKHMHSTLMEQAFETEETISIRYRYNQLIYYARAGRKDRYIKDDSEIDPLCANLVVDRFNSITTNNIDIFDEMLDKTLKIQEKFKKQWKTKTFNRLTTEAEIHAITAIKEARNTEDSELVARILDPFTWAQNNSYKNPYRQEDIRYRTIQGNLVRTKSETIWANCLDYNDIPYAYEPQLIIEGRVMYPDFMPIKPDGSLLIIEHCGLMEDENYRHHWYNKLETYRRGGYFPNRNLLITTEEDLMVEGRLDELLLRYYYL